MTQFEEPPELTDRAGERIVVMRDGNGNLFSNHPDYPLALAMHEQSKAIAAQNAEREAAEQAAESAAKTEEDDGVEVEDDVEELADNGDGDLTYQEMDTKALVAEAKTRGLDLKSPAKRSTVIALLQADDQEKAEK